MARHNILALVFNGKLLLLTLGVKGIRFKAVCGRVLSCKQKCYGFDDVVFKFFRKIRLRKQGGKKL